MNSPNHPGVTKSARMPRIAAVVPPGLVAFALPVLLLVACGGGGDAPPSASTPAPAPAPATPPAPASTPDAPHGKLLYRQHCSVCHGQSPDARALAAAGDGSVVLQAIGLVRIMNILSTSIRPVEAQDIGAWLVDPR